MESFSQIITCFSQRKDSIFYLSLVLAFAVVAAGEGLWRLRKSKTKDSSAVLPNLPKDDSRLEFLWTVIPVFVLVCLASVQIDKISAKQKGETYGSLHSKRGTYGLLEAKPAGVQLDRTSMTGRTRLPY